MYAKDKKRTNNYVVGTNHFKVEAVKDHKRARSHHESFRIKWIFFTGNNLASGNSDWLVIKKLI